MVTPVDTAAAAAPAVRAFKVVVEKGIFLRNANLLVIASIGRPETTTNMSITATPIFRADGSNRDMSPPYDDGFFGAGFAT